MRLDKFLKISRIIKRRTIAKEVCDLGNVHIGDRVLKAGTEVNPGDILTLKLGNRCLTIKILGTPEVVRATQAAETYEIINDQQINNKE